MTAIIIDDATFKQRVRQGDRTTVPEARAAYKQNRDVESLLRYANVLYTFRNDPDLAAELEGLGEEFIRIGQLLTLAQAEMVAAYALWISRRIAAPRKLFMRTLVRNLFEEMCPLFEEAGPDAVHAAYLLRLTYAELCLDEHLPQAAARELLCVRLLVHGPMGDSYQSMRTWRRLGLIWRRAKPLGLGHWLGLQAVWGALHVSWFEAAKSIAALAPPAIRRRARIEE